VAARLKGRSFSRVQQGFVDFPRVRASRRRQPNSQSGALKK
jgi:hypothetical protein